MEKYYVIVGNGKHTQYVYKRDEFNYKFSSRKEPMIVDKFTACIICMSLTASGFDAKVCKLTKEDLK